MSSTPQHNRRSLHNAILWFARRLLGHGGVYSGKIEVSIKAPSEGETITLTSTKSIDGLSGPESEALGSNSWTNRVGQMEILKVMFSRDEIRMLSQMVSRKPMKASAVMDLCQVEKSKFWVLWGNLQHRGIVDDAEGEDGFVIAVKWIVDHLKELNENMPSKVERPSKSRASRPSMAEIPAEVETPE